MLKSRILRYGINVSKWHIFYYILNIFFILLNISNILLNINYYRVYYGPYNSLSTGPNTQAIFTKNLPSVDIYIYIVFLFNPLKSELIPLLGKV